MIAQSRAHLRSAGEGYWQHFRFATTFGLLAMAAGFAAILHAFVPAVCTSTASRIIRHLGNLLEDRSQNDRLRREFMVREVPTIALADPRPLATAA